ncbi:hypothetical protein C0Q70_20943 [Pomacea canaliculata]|uniref:Rho guanine nucleotide exchange factor 6/7 coiled-coil domain-containing protein n=1 Tax=Pomacea canaliculata TaxID=400727 RepID=A0A2T7NB48_POMCA|nr:hypothetical protein C0Q70_20943 [Pomacea canaliculata]
MDTIVLVKAVLNNPNFIIAEEEKIFDDSENQEEKTLVDTVYSLKDKVRHLEQEQKCLRHDLEEERQARLRLENTLRNFSLPVASLKLSATAAAASPMGLAVDRDITPPT